MKQIVVLGMHGSGASVVAHLLHAMGAHPGEGDALEGLDLSDRGSPWEPVELRQLNDRALASMGKSWLDCGNLNLHDMPLSELRCFRNGAKAMVESLDKRRPWVISDPRITILLDLWRPYLTQPVYVIAHRSPEAVAPAVRGRHGVIGLQFSLPLWERYNVSALSGTTGSPRVLVSYDRMLQDLQGTALQLHRDLAELNLDGLRAPTAKDLQAFAAVMANDAKQERAQLSPNPQQLRLAKSLRNGAALRERPPDVSAPALAVLERAAHRWPGQPWLTGLLRLRDAELRLRDEALARRDGELRRRDEELRHWRDPQTFKALRSAVANRSKGVFVIGCPRSGTSVLSWALAEHPNFLTGAESDYLLPLFGKGRLQAIYRETYERADQGWFRQQKLSFAEFAAMVGFGVEQLFVSRADGKRWVDATPGYTLMVEELLGLFPAAKFLHVVRDGRAVVNSMVSSGFDTDWASDFAVACRTWVRYVMLGRAAAQAHPEQVMEVYYDALAADPKAEFERLFSFLGEWPCARAIDFMATKRINSSYGNVRQQDIRVPKDPATAPRRPWRDWSAEQTRTFADIAGGPMADLGYDLSA